MWVSGERRHIWVGQPPPLASAKSSTELYVLSIRFNAAWPPRDISGLFARLWGECQGGGRSSGALGGWLGFTETQGSWCEARKAGARAAGALCAPRVPPWPAPHLPACTPLGKPRRRATLPQGADLRLPGQGRAPEGQASGRGGVPAAAAPLREREVRGKAPGLPQPCASGPVDCEAREEQSRQAKLYSSGGTKRCGSRNTARPPCPGPKHRRSLHSGERSGCQKSHAKGWAEGQRSGQAREQKRVVAVQGAKQERQREAARQKGGRASSERAVRHSVRIGTGNRHGGRARGAEAAPKECEARVLKRGPRGR